MNKVTSISVFFAIVVASLGSKQAMAQNNTSPYSMLGIGDLEKSNFDRTSGMGHAGVARFLCGAGPAFFIL
jgi:hypothetical protein